MFPRRTHLSSDARITSPKNPLIREIRKAVDRGTLTSEGLAVAEGFHLLEEALRSPAEVELVVVAESAAHRIEGKAAVIVVPDPVLESCASTETSQGVITLVRPAVFATQDVFREVPLIVVLDGLQDPGNAGTLIRTAEAFGATGVAFTKGTVSAWNTKTIRASAGSVFRMPMLLNATPELLLADHTSVNVYTTMPRDGRSLNAVDFRKSSVIVIGGEARGAGPEWAAAGHPVSIPTHTVESLNAGVAGAVVLYEAFRQRNGT